MTLNSTIDDPVTGLALTAQQREALADHVARKAKHSGSSVPAEEIRLAGLLLATLHNEISVPLAVAGAQRLLRRQDLGRPLSALMEGLHGLHVLAAGADRRRLSAQADILEPALRGLEQEVHVLLAELNQGVRG